MDVMGIVARVGVIAWLYLLSVCKRGKLGFYHFIIGSVGLFIIGMSQVGRIQQTIICIFVVILAQLGNATGMFQSFPDIGAFLINNGQTSMTFYIDLECSGIIEMLVFTCLLLFFEVYTKKERIKLAVSGVLWIALFNIIRMAIILAIIYYGGAGYYLVAHAVIGRMVFYVLTIILYYVVFTKKQINRQKVGQFAYESSILDQ